MKRLVTALLGATGLAVLLVGVPFVLWTVSRHLIAAGTLPDSLPDIWTALWAQDTGQLFLAVLLLIGTVAWLVALIGFLLELPAVVRHRPVRRVRGFGLAQRTAGVLLAMIIAGAPAGVAAAETATAAPPLEIVTAIATNASPAVSTAHGMPAAAAPVTNPETGSAPQTALTRQDTKQLTYIVQPRDTLWGIAERTMGDGTRSQQILTLNTGITQPDGGTLTADSFPRPGWVLTLPADARIDDQVVVQPGDTLTKIAQDRLGDASRYRELAALNGIYDPDRIDVGAILLLPAPAPIDTPTVTVQPGDTLTKIAQDQLGDAGRYRELAVDNGITDPNRIDVGTVLVIPAPAVGAESAPGNEQQSTAPSPAGAEPTTPPTVDTQDSAPLAAPNHPPDAAGSVVTEAPAPMPVDPSVPPTVPATAAPTTSPAPTQAPAPATTPDSAGQPDEASSVAAIAPWMALTTVAAAAIWGGIIAAQRRGTRRRRNGQVVHTPSLAAIHTERALRAAAADVDIAWLDLALRCLGTVTDPGDIPDVTGAEFSPTGLRLLLATETPAPTPFIADGPTWWLPASAQLPDTAADAIDQVAPLPTLTSIGTDGPTTVMLDLEAAGSVSVAGDRAAATRLLQHMVVELAHQSWSDDIDVLLVGWGHHLVTLNPDRLTVADDVPTALRHVWRRARAVGAALTDLDLTAPNARVQASDSWTPQIVLVDQQLTNNEHLRSLADVIGTLSRSGCAATSILIVGDEPADVAGIDTRLIIDQAGRLTVDDGWGGQRRITAAGISNSELDELLALTAELTVTSEPPAAVHDDTVDWSQDMDSTGALIPTISLVEPIDTVDPDTTSGENATPTARPEATPAALTALSAALADDPGLDDDLASWRSVQIDQPKIAILGPVDITANGPAPAQRRAWFSEVAVYLALHRTGVTLDKFTDDLWAGRSINSKTRNETVSRLRAWMGGPDFVPIAGKSNTYQLTGRLLDLDLFMRARKRGDAYAAAHRADEALTAYQAALSLVRGIPLPEVDTGNTWSWMLNSGRREHLIAPGQITDCAHRAVQVALSLRPQRLDIAREAANIAHRAEPTSELPLLDLLVIAAAEGDMATAQRRAWDMLTVNGVEAVEDLPDHETFKIIDRIFPHGLKAVSSR